MVEPPRSERRRRLTLLSSLLALSVVVVVGRQAGVEQYWLWKLDSDDEATRQRAGEALVTMESRRALPRLVEILREQARTRLPGEQNVRLGERLASTSVTFGTGRTVPFDEALVALRQVLGIDLVLTTDPLIPFEVSLPGGPRPLNGAEALTGILKQADEDLVFHLGDGSVVVVAPRSPPGRPLASPPWLPVWESLWAATCLAALGEPAARALLPLVQDDDSLVRLAAIYSLGQMGASAAVAVPALSERLGDRHPLVPVLAAAALGRIGPEAAPAVEALRRALNSRNSELAARAAEALVSVVGEVSASGRREEG